MQSNEEVSVGVNDFPPDVVAWCVVITGGRNASTGGKDVRGERGGSTNAEGKTDCAKVDFLPNASKAAGGIEIGITSVS